jgi:hypothetical protein|tara:strand:- start:562 stop:765 length:204 start_codon:yes stop_codon:yes gene_type:complete
MSNKTISEFSKQLKDVTFNHADALVNSQNWGKLFTLKEQLLDHKKAELTILDKIEAVKKAIGMEKFQ